MSALTTLVDSLYFTECPRWRDGRLYFTDRYTRRVLAVSEMLAMKFTLS